MVLRKAFKNFTAVALVAVTSVSIAFVPYVSGGGSEVKNTGNVKIYKNSAGDHVQVLNISGGAKLRLVQDYAGWIDLSTRYQPGYKHGFHRHHLMDCWKHEKNAVALVNGQFFATGMESVTILSFKNCASGVSDGIRYEVNFLNFYFKRNKFCFASFLYLGKNFIL